MAENVSLSSAVRANLIALQSTSELIARTQGRLSTGLRVAAAVDDPVSFFQAKDLANRADDFTTKKRGIDQGISTITAASDAVTGIEALVQQLKGLVLSAKSATTATEVVSLVSQFNDLRSQINNLSSDATYQGINLVNGTGQTLTVNFSNDTASILNVLSSDVRASRFGLDIAKLSAATNTTGVLFNRGFISAGTLTGGGSALVIATVAPFITVTVGGQTAATVAVGDTFSATYDGISFSVRIVSTTTGILSSDAANLSTIAYIDAATYAIGSSLAFRIATSLAHDDTGISVGGDFDFFSGGVLLISGTLTVTETEAIRVAGVGFTTEYNSRITNLDAGLTTLRSRAQTLGTNVALLQTRLNFTKAYVSTLTIGQGKLTLADLNEEGANLLALQTRQQLGIQSLAFAGQAEQTILTLFR